MASAGEQDIQCGQCWMASAGVQESQCRIASVGVQECRIASAGVQDGQCRIASVLLMSVLSKDPRHNTSDEMLCPTQGGNKSMSRVCFFLHLHSFKFKQLTCSVLIVWSRISSNVRREEFFPTHTCAQDNK